MDRFDAEECQPGDVVNSANTLPFFAERKLVLVEAVPWFGNAKKAETEEKPVRGLEILESYLQNPSPSTCLVMICDKVNKAKKLTKAVQKSGVIAEFVPLKGGAALSWLNDRLKSFGLTMTPDAQQQFLFYCDGSCGFAELELQKLACYLPSGGEITTELIENLVSRNQAANVFQLIDRVAEGKLEASLALLGELLLTENAFTLIPLLAGHFKTVLMVKNMAARGYNTKAMLDATGKSSAFVIEKAIRQGRKYTEEQLKKILEIWLQADIKLKTGVSASVNEVLETAIVQICYLSFNKHK